MDWHDLLNLHRNPKKRELLHFLKEVSSADDFCPTVTAFANSKGGSILIGVDFNNFHLRGANDVDENWIVSSIKTQCHSEIEINLESVYRNNRKILIVHVLEGKQKPYSYNRKCYLRENGKTRLATIHEEQDFLHAAERHADHHPVTSQIQTETPPKPTHSPHPLSTLNINEPHKDDKPATVTIDLETTDLETAKDIEAPQIPAPEQPKIQAEPITEPGLKVDVTSHVEKEDTPADFETTEKLEIDPTTIAKTYFLNRRQKRALTFLKHHDQIKNKKYRTMYKVSHKTAHIELADMVDKGILRVEGSGRSTSYVLTLGKEAQATPPKYTANANHVIAQRQAQAANQARLNEENVFEEDDINPELLESSLVELKNLMGEVADAAENPIEYPTGQNSFEDRKSFLLTYLKSNNMITDHHYAELLNISISVAQNDLEQMESQKMVKKIVNLGQIYYLLEAASESSGNTGDSQPPRILALPY